MSRRYTAEAFRALVSPEVRTLQDRFYAEADPDERMRIAVEINTQLWREAQATEAARPQRRQKAVRKPEIKMEGHHPWK